MTMTRRKAVILTLLLGFLGGTLLGVILPAIGAVIWLVSWIAAPLVYIAYPRPRREIDYARCHAFGHDWVLFCQCCETIRIDPVVAAEYDAALDAARSEVAALEQRQS